MIFRLWIYVAVAAAWFVLQGHVVRAYEPTYHEILIQKERLETFCKMRDNQRRFDICERFKELKGKLPHHVGDIDTFRKIYEQKPK